MVGESIGSGLVPPHYVTQQNVYREGVSRVIACRVQQHPILPTTKHRRPLSSVYKSLCGRTDGLGWCTFSKGGESHVGELECA